MAHQFILFKNFAKSDTFQFFEVTKQCHRDVAMLKNKGPQWKRNGTLIQAKFSSLVQIWFLFLFTPFQDLLVESDLPVKCLPQRLAVSLATLTSTIKYFCFSLSPQFMNTITIKGFKFQGLNPKIPGIISPFDLSCFLSLLLLEKCGIL